MADWLHTLDPGLTSRAVRASARIARAEQQILRAVAAAMNSYLRTATEAILGPGYRVPRQLVAAAGVPDLDAWPSDHVWVAAVQTHITPVTAKVFGEAFAAQARSTALSDYAARMSYMEQVVDRLSANLWPTYPFEEVRYELLEGLANGESIDQLRDRIGAVTNIDAYSRDVRAHITQQRYIRDSPASSAAQRADARRNLSKLWPQLDDADTAWHYQARRVARTETIGAVNGGSWAGASARAGITGDDMFKQWLATADGRTRDSHSYANGQVRALADPFMVGGAALQHPGEAGGPAAEVINCRCTLLYLDAAEAAPVMAAQGTPLPISTTP